VVQDIFLTETAELADVVLPAASFAEKDGTFTNTERRVQLVRKAIEPVGDSMADWQILQRVMNLMGYDKTYNCHPSEIFAEMATVTPSYAGIDYDSLEEKGSLQWPCPSQGPSGDQYLHKDKFARGKGLFKPSPYVPAQEQPDEKYPLILTTGRVLYQYHTRTMTGRVDGLNAHVPESYIELSPHIGR
jgi:predicted molibdopterin-dependent oxidoreductase YjgC